MSRPVRKVRNPFYANVIATGIRIITAIDPLPHGRRRPSNPYYDRVQTLGGVALPPRRGRPRAGEDRPRTTVKAVRLPVTVWQRLDEHADRRRISRADALREAVGRWLDTA